MLENYSNSYKQTTNQILIISKEGIIIGFESILYKAIDGKHISTIHPFFETILDLLKNPNQTYAFKCINLNIGDKIHTIDSTLFTNGINENAAFVFSDLSKQYDMFQNVAQLRNEAALKSQLLDYQNSLIQQKEAFKDSFITNFSHEILLPINTISGFSTLLENTNLKQEQRYTLGVIKNTNNKLKVMLNAILDLSKLEIGHFEIYENRFNLLHELQLIKAIYTQKCKDKGLNLVVNIDNDCPKFVVSDKYRMAQIVNNLIGNAIKFTSAGTVILSVKPKQSKNEAFVPLEFMVEDTGIGIPKDKQKHIFNRFYQLENDRYNTGSGLGLTITRNLVNALNGKISVKSKENEGSTFKVLLNLKISHDHSPDIIIKKSSIKTQHFEHKILVAEPLAKDKLFILKILNKTKKYDVVVVETGDEVIEELHKKYFDVVLLNLKLPTMDGLDTARYIRFSKFPHFSNIPIIAISENPSTKEEKMCKDKKINSYIGKPYDQTEVLKKVKYSIQKKQA